jgi:hypothetical protein
MTRRRFGGLTDSERATADAIRNSNTLEAQLAARRIAEGQPIETWQQDLRRLVEVMRSIDESLATIANKMK